MKIIIGIGRLVFAILLFIAVNQGCEKEDPKPILETIVAHEIFSTSAISGADIITVEGLRLTAKGVCWSTTPEPTIADSHTNDGRGLGNFKSLMHGLLPSTSYYYRAYAVTDEGVAYGNTLKFKTDIEGTSFIETDSISLLTFRTARVYGSYKIWGNEPRVIRYGFCYAYEKLPEVVDYNVTQTMGGDSDFNAFIHFEEEKPAKVRAFVEMENGEVFYGDALNVLPQKLEITTIDRITFRSARVLIEHGESPYFFQTKLYWGTEKENLDQVGYFNNRYVTQHYTNAWNLLPNTTYFVWPIITFTITPPGQSSGGYTVSDWADYASFTTPPVSDIGSGTYDAPYTIDGALYLAPFTEHIWVEGYIVGEFDRIGRHSNFSPPFVQEFAIMLANEIDEMFVGNTLWVTLPSGPISQALNLKDNPGNKGRKLRIQGNVYRDYKVYMNQIQEFELE